MAKNNFLKKYKKQIKEIKKLSDYLYKDEYTTEILIKKFFYSNAKYSKRIIASVINISEQVDLLKTDGKSINSALKHLKKLLLLKIEEMDGYKQQLKELPAKDKTTEVEIKFKKIIDNLDKDIDFWNNAKEAEKKEKETINNPDLLLVDIDPKQLSLPFEEKKDESK